MHDKPIDPGLLAQILSETVQKRFWSKVEIRGPDECWPWLASKAGGYGQMVFRLCDWKRQKRFASHQLSWMMSNKSDIPVGKWILHSCIASRGCCNPKHLRLGTRLENIQDMDNQGRRDCRKGELSPNVKLTNDKVLQLRAAYATGKYTQEFLSKEFGIGHTRVSEIITRKAWTHI